MWLLRSALLIATFMATQTLSAFPGGDPFKQYYILRISDYAAITGCAVREHEYHRSLNAALRFLVFRDNDTSPNNSIQYARRHTLPLFRALHHDHATPETTVPEHCIAVSLRQIGFALKLLDASWHYRWQAHNPINFRYDPALLERGDVDQRAFPIMSRSNYIAQTGREVTSESYQN